MLHTSTFARFEDMSVSECGQSWEKYVTALSLWGTGFLCLGDPILIKHHWGDSTSNQWLSYRFGPKWTSSHFLLIYFCSNFDLHLFYNLFTALCVDPHCKVSIGQYTKMCTSPHIFSSSIISDDKYLKKIFDHFHFHCIFDHLSHEQS